MLTQEEINKIFSWLPYRQDWPVDRNQKDDNIEDYFGQLVSAFNNNAAFNCQQTQDGGTTNYLEFICYPAGPKFYSGKSILVFVSLCAPIAAYGKTLCDVSDGSWGHNYVAAEEIGIIQDLELEPIGREIEHLLRSNNFSIIDRGFASRRLPREIVDTLDAAFDDKYLDGIFQRAD